MQDNGQSENRVLTVPNAISLLRLLLIPVIVYLYTVRRSLPWTLVAIGLSGLSDILDGTIARRFHMVSNVGKILDPVADKLTQAALVVCLWQRHPALIGLFILLAVKEVAQGIIGLAAVRRGHRISSSQWYGKACTVVIYFSMLIMLIWQDMPAALMWVLLALCAGMLVLSLALYIRFFRTLAAGGADAPGA